MIVQRTLAVLSAALLVGAVALATLGPANLPLGQAIFMLDHDVMQIMRTGIEQHVSAWLWRYVAVPVLVRPVWLVPAALGIICAGAALSLSNRKSAHRSHRRS